MKNYIMLDGKKIAISEETANNLRGKTRAPHGNTYYYLDCYIGINSTKDMRGVGDDMSYDSDNYFLNKEDAEKMATKFKKLLKDK